MSLIDLASMVLAPTAVKDGKVYNAIPNDQDFTFSRGTEATRVNSAGLIEKARTNYLLQSNAFDTTWINGNTSEVGGQTGYDGSNDAWLLSKTATSYSYIQQSVTVSGIFTFSVYAKAGTLDILNLRESNGSRAQFDLTNGTSSFGDVSTSMESIGNGWYRCSAVFNKSISNIRMYIDWGETTAGNILIQDAQLEQGLVATDLITTTTSSVTVGITDDLPRVDYSGGGCPSLLLEPSRTNLITQSEYLDAWTKLGCTIANNESTSPEGVDNASKFIASSGLSVKIAYQIISSTNSVAHTVSAFYKSDEYNYAFLRVGGQSPSPYVIYNLSNQSIVSTANATSTKIEDYGSGWYRVSMTYTANNTTNAVNVSFLPTSGYSLDSVNQPSYNGDGSSGGYVYGVQLESSASYVSSYLPSYGTSTSRSADSCTLTGASNLIGQTEGTILCEFTLDELGYNVDILAINNSTNSEYIAIFKYADNLMRSRIRANSINNTIDYSVTATGIYKVALKYNASTFSLFINGVKINEISATISFTSTIERVFVAPNIYVGLGRANYNELLTLPEALTDDQCIALTTI